MRLPKIGLLGGTFDPPHLAHLILAQVVLEKLKLDQIWFVPSYIPPHKRLNQITPARHRLKMLKLALAHNPNFGVCEVELRRRGISYTVDTLRELSLQKPKKRLYLIIGSDSLELLPGWKEPKDIFRLACVVVVNRPGHIPGLRRSRLGKVITQKAPLLEISSSEIRERVKSGEDISYWVPPRVKQYIESKRLYHS